MALHVRSQIASLRRLLTLLRRQLTVDPTTLCIPVGERPLHLLRPLPGDPVPLVGDVATRAIRPVTLVGDPAALVSHPVTLVGGAHDSWIDADDPGSPL